MQIAIISDTHDNTPAVVWIVEYLNQHTIRTALHAGDMISPGICRRFVDHYEGHLHFVFGNNDGEQAIISELAATSDKLSCYQEEMQLELAGKKIFMNHYSSIAELVAQSGEFAVCIGGHDHQYRVVEHGNSLFINPGNTVTKDKWDTYQPNSESSFVVLDLATMQHVRVMVPVQF